MIAVLAALILVTLAGCALTRLIDRELRGAAFFGSAIFIGCGYAALIMFFLTVVHVEWSRTVVMISLLGCSGPPAHPRSCRVRHLGADV